MSWPSEIDGIEEALQIVRSTDPIAGVGSLDVDKVERLRSILWRACALFDVAAVGQRLLVRGPAPTTIAEFDADETDTSTSFAILCRRASELGPNFKRWFGAVLAADSDLVDMALSLWREIDEKRDAALVEQLRSANSLGCESPIESRMLRALRKQFIDLQVWDIELPRPALFHGRHGPWHLVGQHDTAGFRLDFAALSKEHSVAIECDGHDYHERTKEQARHDRSRDRALQALGWRVLRFTGSEIHTDADGCAEEVVRFLDSLGVA